MDVAVGGLLIILAVSAAPSEATAGDSTPDAATGAIDLNPTSRYEFKFTPGLWLPRVRGSSRLGPAGVATKFELDRDLGLDDQERAFEGELLFRKDDMWELLVSGFDFSTSAQQTLPMPVIFGNLALGAGAATSSHIDMTSFSFEFGWTAHRPLLDRPRNRTNDGLPIVDLRVTPILAVRWVDVDLSVASGGVEQSAGTEWVGAMGGVRLDVEMRPQGFRPWLRMLEFTAGAAIGPALGGDGGLMWQIRAGLGLHFTESIGVQVGYRLVDLYVDDGDFAFDAGLQGLFFAGEIRF